MEKTVFDKLSKLDWFDCDDDVNDFISDIAEGIKEGDLDMIVNKAKFWLKDMYGGFRIDGRAISDKEVESTLRSIL